MDKYTDLSERLGRGSFGIVKKVKRNSDGKLLAMKVIEIASEETAENAYNEHLLLESLQHPNIVKFYETFMEKDHLYLVMEYCEESDLQKKVKEKKQAGEYFSEELILEYFTQVCLAVQRLHDNLVIHRDIKVHNVFLTSNGMVKLGDFGISKRLDNTRDFGQTWLGTPFYVSPEMISHSRSSYKSDIWMLGCLLHELCSLEKPFSGEYFTVIRKIQHESYSEVPSHYSPFVHDLIDKLLSKNPDERPPIKEILEYPEIKEIIQKIKLKYAEAYEAKQPKPIFIKRSRSEVHDPLNPWGFPDKDISEATIKDTPQADPFVPVKRRSNNIHTLVQQKKATLSPSSTEKPLGQSVATPHQTFTSVCLGTNSRSTSQNRIIHPFKISTTRSTEIDPFYDDMKYSITLETQEAEDDDNSREEFKFEGYSTPSIHKGTEGIRKPYNNLSINIPGGSEQNENRGYMKKEKLKPAKLKSPLNETGDSSNVPTTKVSTQKSFSFTKYLFDHKSPVSPNRTFWVSQFLKQKLGDEKFEKVRELLENSGNPTQLLKEQPEEVLNIIGEEKRDCLLMLNFLILHNTNSVTPTGETKGQLDKPYSRTSDAYRISRSLKSPASSNPFLKNIFPCVTDPDSIETHSQCSIDDIRPTRKIVSDIPKGKDQYGLKVESLSGLCESVKDAN